MNLTYSQIKTKKPELFQKRVELTQKVSIGVKFNPAEQPLFCAVGVLVLS